MRTCAAVAPEAGKPLEVMVEIPRRDQREAGDHVVPLYTPECRQCASCLSSETNLCTAIRATQGDGLMPHGTTRFSMLDGTLIYYLGCSTFSNYTVLQEIAVANVREVAPFENIC